MNEVDEEIPIARDDGGYNDAVLHGCCSGVRIDGRGGHGGVMAGILLVGGRGDRLQWRIVLPSPLSATMCDDM